jgi:hypothetical protein
MFINVLMRMLAYDLEQRGIRDPLRQPFRYADLWSELARLQGEPVPPDIATIVKEPPFTGFALPPQEEP